MFLFAAGISASMKVAYAAAGTLTVSTVGWSSVLFAQDVGDPVGTVIPAAALTATSGALVWVVKQIVGGNLVHRDPAEAIAKLADALDRMNDIAEKGLEREKLLTSLLAEKARASKDG